MQPNGLEVVPQPGAMVKQDFGARELAVQAETASTAVAAQARAAVEARYKMALARPRDIDDVRMRLLKECRRPGFAEKAIYHKPIGKEGVEGPSIRLAEAAIRQMGNILVETPTVYDDREKRILRVVVTDLETNATFQSDVVLEKTIERRDSKGRVVVAERQNSYGQKVFIVLATEDELLNKVNALLSKAVRTNGLRLVPADILEECLAICRATTRDRDAKDPDAAKKRIADSFATINVSPSDLREYLGHDLATIAPKELEELRGIYSAIVDGEATWAATLETRRVKTQEPTAPPRPGAPPPATTAAPAQPEQKAAPVEAPHDPVTGEVKEASPAPAPASDDPDSFTDRLIAEMSAAVESNNLSALTKLAQKAKEVPSDRQDEVLKHYSEAKAALKAKATGGAR